jgi:hypothetical protein
MKTRHKRSAAIGVLATLVFGWAAVYSFDVPVEELAWLLLYCVIGVLVVMLLAALCIGLLIGLRRLLELGRREEE